MIIGLYMRCALVFYVCIYISIYIYMLVLLYFSILCIRLKQVGQPNLGVDGRLAAFGRRYLPRARRSGSKAFGVGVMVCLGFGV